MDIKMGEVPGIHINSVSEKENIEDHFKIEELLKIISSLSFYYRDPICCPFARGNWVVDLHFTDGGIYSIKLPKSMSEERIHKYLKPLTDKMKGINKYNEH